jgi:RHS repeat-associated protein
VTGAITASFTYDGLGRRVARTISGTTENYLYDGLDIIQQLDGSGAVGANYFRSLGIDEPWLRSDLGATITNSVYLVDALGSIVALTDTNGAIQTEYAYDPFGVTTNFGASSKNSHQFTGRENDGTGLYYYRARYYIPALGRFISEDPIGFAGGQINIYGYVGNDPIESTDPSGQWLTGTLPVGIGSGIGEAGGTIGAGEILGPIAGGIISGVFAGEAIVGALPGETTGPANDVTSVTSAYPPAQYPDPTSDPTSGPDYGQAPQRYKNNNAAPGSPASPGSPGPNDPNDPGDPNDPISKCKSTRDVSILACIAQYRIDGDLGDLYECCKEATRVYNECLVDNGVGGDAP